MSNHNLTTRTRIDSWVVCIAWVGALAIFLVFFLSTLSQAASNPSLTKARLTGLQAIDRASDAWKTIYDYQTFLHQVETHPSGQVKEFWARVQLVRPTADQKDLIPSFRLELFDQPITLASRIPQDATPTKEYFSDASNKFYTINPTANTITIEPLNEQTSPLPEFMYLAGFMDFNIETFKEKAFIDDTVYQENVEEVDTYRIRIQPRKEKKEVEPSRFLWIDRKTSLPKQFAILNDVEINVVFFDTQTNQGLKSVDLVPHVREDTVIDDRTK